MSNHNVSTDLVLGNSACAHAVLHLLCISCVRQSQAIHRNKCSDTLSCKKKRSLASPWPPVGGGSNIRVHLDQFEPLSFQLASLALKEVAKADHTGVELLDQHHLHQQTIQLHGLGVIKDFWADEQLHQLP